MAAWVNTFLELKTDGRKLEGESITPGFEGWIELQEFEWEAKSEALGQSQQNRAADVSTAPEKLQVKKRFDTASMAMMKSLRGNEECKGQIVVLGRDTLRGQRFKLYFTGRLDEISFDTETTDKSATLMETVKFEITWIGIEYLTTPAEGKAVKRARVAYDFDKKKIG